MIPYTPKQLLFFFLIYCFIGWCIESTWVSLHQHKFVNRGFMRGPFIPIYGFGAMTLLLVGTPLLKWPVAVFFAGMFAASILEFFTGMAMEAIFKVRYWDYSDKPFNIKGHVCLFTSVCWGVLAVVEDYFLHKPIEALSEYMTLKEMDLIVFSVSVYFIVDVTLSFKAAFDLRDIIIKMEKAKEDLRIMQKRLDVYLAYASEDAKDFVEETKEAIEDRIEEHKERAEDTARDIEAKFEELKKRMEERPSIFDGFEGNAFEEIRELKEKFIVHKAERFGLPSFKDFYKRGIFIGNPTLGSKKFKDTVDSIKAYVEERKNK